MADYLVAPAQQQPLLNKAIDLYLTANRLFSRGDFTRAKAVSRIFEAHKYDFARVSNDKENSARHTICIVAHQELAETRELITSIANLFKEPDYCLYLVSNANSDLFEYVEEMIAGPVVKIVMGANFGASAGRNAAIRFAVGDTITFLDDDGITTPESILALHSTMVQHDAVAVRGRVTPKSQFDIIPDCELACKIDPLGWVMSE